MHTIAPARSGKHARDDYWRLEVLHEYDQYSKTKLRRLLEADGAKLSPLDGRDQLQQVSRRMQCGQMNYDSCTSRELWKFIEDRKLMTVARPLKSVITPQVRIKVLEAADDKRTFEKYQDLPPELRERVTEYYLREFRKALIFPTQPPLARTGRLVRNEVLPLFYQRCQFWVHFDCSLPVDDHRIKPCSKTLEWLLTLEPKNLSLIRNVSIEVLHDLDECSEDPYFSFEFKLGIPNSVYEYNFDNTEFCEDVEEVFYQEELCKVLDRIRDRESGRLILVDIYAFRNAIVKARQRDRETQR